MSVTEGQIRGKYHQDTNVPRSNLAISRIHKNIERHTAHTLVSTIMQTHAFPIWLMYSTYPDTGLWFVCVWGWGVLWGWGWGCVGQTSKGVKLLTSKSLSGSSEWLHVNTTTSNVTIIDECGKCPPSVTYHVNCMMYFLRLRHISDTSPVNIVFKEQRRLHLLLGTAKCTIWRKLLTIVKPRSYMPFASFFVRIWQESRRYQQQMPYCWPM